MRKKIAVTVLVAAFLITGCLDFDKKPENNGISIKNGKTDLLRPPELMSNIKQEETVINNISSFQHSECIYKGDIITNINQKLTRIGAGGTVVWEAPETKIESFYKYILDGNKIIAQGNAITNCIYEYKGETGELTGTWRLPEDRWFRPNYGSGYNNRKLYMLLGKKTVLTEEDQISDTVFAEYDLNLGKITQEMELPKNAEYYDSDVVYDNGVVYFCTGQNSRKGIGAKIMAVDISTWSVKWEYVMPKTVIKNTYSEELICAGGNSSNIVIYGEKIVFPGDGLICFNKNTGEKLWSSLAPFDCSFEDGTTSVESELYFDEKSERIYYSGVRGDFGKINVIEPSEENLFCIDINTGKKIWGRGTGFCESGKPKIFNGILYLPSNRKMMAVNPENGNLIGGLWYKDQNEAQKFIHKIGDEYFLFGGSSIMKVDIELQKDWYSWYDSQSSK